MTVADPIALAGRSSVVFSGTLIFYSTNLLCCRATPPLPRIRVRQAWIARKSGSVFKEPSRICASRIVRDVGCSLAGLKMSPE